MVPAFAVIISALVMSVNSFGTNSGTCNYAGLLAAANAGGMNQAATRVALTGANSRFSLSISPNPIQPGMAHTITFTRKPGMGTGGFRGLLLYVVDSSGTNRIGAFDTTAANVQIVPNTVNGGACNTAATITHTITAATTMFTATQGFTWTAPATIAGPVTIYGVAYLSPNFNKPDPLVVQVNQSSPSTVAPGGTTMAPGGTGMAVDCVCSMTPRTLGAGVSAQIVKNTTHAGILIRGPLTNWFALGFGTQMINSPAYIVQGGVAQRYQIGGTRSLAGVGTAQVPSGFTTLRVLVPTASSRSVCLLTSLTPSTGISFAGTSVSVIYSQGAAAVLSASGHGTNRGRGSLSIGTSCTSTSSAADIVPFGFGFVVAIVAFVFSLF